MLLIFIVGGILISVALGFAYTKFYSGSLSNNIGSAYVISWVIVLLLMFLLPKEDWDAPKGYENRWIHYTNDSCEIKPNGIFEYILNKREFWLHISGSMQEFKKIRDYDPPSNYCKPPYRNSQEEVLKCLSDNKIIESRLERCYPIAVNRMCQQPGFICSR